MSNVVYGKSRGDFRDCGARGRKHMQGTRLKIAVNKSIPQFVFRQNSNASKLYFLASDESFVSFLYVNELHSKKASFLKAGRIFSFLQMCAWNVLAFKENNVKIKNRWFIHIFFCYVIVISNCYLSRVDSIPSCFFLGLKIGKSSFQFLLTCRVSSVYQSTGPGTVGPMPQNKTASTCSIVVNT